MAHHNPLNDLMYFHSISNYLLSDAELERDVEIQDMGVQLENLVNNCPNGSPDSIPLDHDTIYQKKVPKYEVKEKVRFAFRTKSSLDFMDDGFQWRKYGKKMVKDSPNPRNYFKCKINGCKVKKRVERDREDSSYVITTYEGLHNHQSPSSTSS